MRQAGRIGSKMWFRHSWCDGCNTGSCYISPVKQSLIWKVILQALGLKKFYMGHSVMVNPRISLRHSGPTKVKKIGIKGIFFSSPMQAKVIVSTAIHQ